MDFQRLSVNLSPVIPPAIPPSTGIRPNTDSRPISEKIFFELIFSGSGISLFRSSFPSKSFLNVLNNCFTSLYFRTFSFAFSSSFLVASSTLLNSKNSFINSLLCFFISFKVLGISSASLKILSVIFGAASADATVNAIIAAVRMAAFFFLCSGA